MFINEYGSREDPTIILLATMMVSGTDLHDLMRPYLKGAYHVIAPDQGGHGRRTPIFLRTRNTKRCGPFCWKTTAGRSRLPMELPSVWLLHTESQEA